MLAKRPAPVIGKLSNTIIAGTMWDSSNCPKSPSEFKILSPRGPISCDLTGVGLGIVAAMEKHVDERENQVPAVSRRNSGRSSPIPVNGANNLSLIRGGSKSETEDKESLEDYTFVIGLGKDNKPFSRVYYDGGCENRRGDERKKDDDLRRSKRIHHDHDHHKPSMFTVSPARFVDFPACPVSDFLSSCHMCQKNLHGKDIYMYRGEKAFCSPECRYKHIVNDEKKDKHCGIAELASRSVEVSSSPCNNERIFSPGILAI